MMDGLLYPVDPEGCAPSFGASSTKPHVVGEGTDSTGGRETPKVKVSRRDGILRELCWTRLLCWAPRQRLPFSRGTLTSSVLLCARQAKWQLFQSGDNLTLSAPNRILVPTLTLVWECPLLITWVPVSHPLETEVPQSVERGEAGPWAEWMNEWKAGRLDWSLFQNPRLMLHAILGSVWTSEQLFHPGWWQAIKTSWFIFAVIHSMFFKVLLWAVQGREETGKKKSLFLEFTF